MKMISKSLLAAGFALTLGCFQVASAATITSSIGNTASGLNDGDVPATFLLGGIQSGQAAPFDQNCGADQGGLFDPPSVDCSASWSFSYSALTDPILSASLSLGIVDHDSSASGSQLALFSVDGNDLTTALDTQFEATGGGLDGMYNVYTIDLLSLLPTLADGSADITLDLAGPGLVKDLFGGGLVETTTNGANLIFSTLTIETRDAPPHPAPEPGTLALFGAGVLGLGIYRRRRYPS